MVLKPIQFMVGVKGDLPILSKAKIETLISSSQNSQASFARINSSQELYVR